MKPPANRCFHCKGCGAIAGIALEDSMMGPAGTVFHTKPAQDFNRVAVQCPLYTQLDAASYAEMHADAPTLESFTDLDDGSS